VRPSLRCRRTRVTWPDLPGEDGQSDEIKSCSTESSAATWSAAGMDGVRMKCVCETDLGWTGFLLPRTPAAGFQSRVRDTSLNVPGSSRSPTGWRCHGELRVVLARATSSAALKMALAIFRRAGPSRLNLRAGFLDERQAARMSAAEAASAVRKVLDGAAVCAPHSAFLRGT